MNCWISPLYTIWPSWTSSENNNLQIIFWNKKLKNRYNVYGGLNNAEPLKKSFFNCKFGPCRKHDLLFHCVVQKTCVYCKYFFIKRFLSVIEIQPWLSFTSKFFWEHINCRHRTLSCFSFSTMVENLHFQIMF